MGEGRVNSMGCGVGAPTVCPECSTDTPRRGGAGCAAVWAPGLRIRWTSGTVAGAGAAKPAKDPVRGASPDASGARLGSPAGKACAGSGLDNSSAEAV